jgi:hypothetical protein
MTDEKASRMCWCLTQEVPTQLEGSRRVPAEAVNLLLSRCHHCVAQSASVAVCCQMETLCWPTIDPTVRCRNLLLHVGPRRRKVLELLLPTPQLVVRSRNALPVSAA